MERKIEKHIKGYRTRDGAGINLVRVLGPATISTKEDRILKSIDSLLYWHHTDLLRSSYA